MNEESQRRIITNDDLLGPIPYDIWGEHETYPRADWKYEVQNDDTNLGYWDWVKSKYAQGD